VGKQFGVLTFFLFLFALSCFRLQAQNYSLYDSYYINPYLYNPAEAASNFTYAFANYRKQWLNLEGAPTVATLNFNTLLDQKRAGIGAKISSYSRGVLNTSEALITYAYGVPFNPKNILYFGISGGGSSTSIDQSKVNAANADDPALAYASGFQPSANFGLRFASASGFNLGFVLPQLFGNTYTENQPSQKGFAPINNMLFTFSFKKELEDIKRKKNYRKRSNFKSKENEYKHYAPLEVYALYRYAAAGNNQYEVTAKLNLSDNFWLSVGYRQQYGFIPSLGFAANRFIFCYSYEPGMQPEKGFSSGSHELQIGLRLGKEKKFRFKVPVLHSMHTSTAPITHEARFRERTTDQEETVKTEDRKRYYVYIKEFTEFDKAEDFKKKLIAQKYNGQIFFYPKNKHYYVYTFETIKVSEATEEVKALKTFTKLKEAKILTIIEK